LTKTNTYFLVALGLVAAGLLFVRERLQGQSGAAPRLAGNAGLMLAVSAATSAWFYLSRQAGGNWFLSQYAAKSDVLDFLASHPNRIWGTVRNVFETYWGTFGWEIFHLPQSCYA